MPWAVSPRAAPVGLEPPQQLPATQLPSPPAAPHFAPLSQHRFSKHSNVVHSFELRFFLAGTLRSTTAPVMELPSRDPPHPRSALKRQPGGPGERGWELPFLRWLLRGRQMPQAMLREQMGLNF